MIQQYTSDDLKKADELGGVFQQLKFKNPIRLEHWRDDVCLAIYESFNDVVNAGKNRILDTMFNATGNTASWYLGLISNASFSALAATDVMNSHAGWLEFVGYSQANRPAWGQGAASSQSVTNATAATFTINISSGNVYGLFVVDNNTIGGTSGNLWATAPFAAVVPVVSADQLKVTYTLSC